MDSSRQRHPPEAVKGNTGHALAQNARELLKQVERYLACDELKEIVVVTQKDTPLPARVLGKRVTCISLNRLWGVALP